MNNQKEFLKRALLFLVVGMSFSFTVNSMKESDLEEVNEKDFTPSKIILNNALPLNVSVAWYYEDTHKKTMRRIGAVHSLDSFKECELNCPVPDTSNVGGWRVLSKLTQVAKTTFGGWNVGYDRQIIVSLLSSDDLKPEISFQALKKNELTLRPKSFKNSNWTEWAKRGLFHIMAMKHKDKDTSIEIVSGGFLKLTNFHFEDIYVRVCDPQLGQFFGETIAISPISSGGSKLIAVPSGKHAKGRMLALSLNKSDLDELPLKKSEKMILEDIPYRYILLGSSDLVDWTYSIHFDVERKKLIVQRGDLDKLKESEQKVKTANNQIDSIYNSDNYDVRNDEVLLAETKFNHAMFSIQHITNLIDDLRNHKDLNPEEKVQKQNKLTNDQIELIGNARILAGLVEYEKAKRADDTIKMQYYENDMEINKCRAGITKNLKKINEKKIGIDTEEELKRKNFEFAETMDRLEKENKILKQKIDDKKEKELRN